MNDIDLVLNGFQAPIYEKSKTNSSYKESLKDLVHQSAKTEEIVQLVNESYPKVLNQYMDELKLDRKSIIFVTRGNTVFRLIYLNFLNKIPSFLREIISSYYDQYFVKTDFDFDILINPDIKNYEEVYKQIGNLIYLTTCHVAMEINSDRNKYFQLSFLQAELRVRYNQVDSGKLKYTQIRLKIYFKQYNVGVNLLDISLSHKKQSRTKFDTDSLIEYSAKTKFMSYKLPRLIDNVCDSLADSYDKGKKKKQVKSINRIYIMSFIYCYPNNLDQYKQNIDERLKDQTKNKLLDEETEINWLIMSGILGSFKVIKANYNRHMNQVDGKKMTLIVRK